MIKKLSENLKQAKQYLKQGKISKEDIITLATADPTPQKKYTGWMSKIWISEHPDIDDLRNTIEEFNNFLNRGRTEKKDINQFESFKKLKDEVDRLNSSGEGTSSRQLENDYEVIVDNSDLLIISPHTHEASRKLGLSKFAFRDCPEGKDSAWCTTYKTPDHFNDYYYNQNITFYYIRVKSEKLIGKLKQTFSDKYKQLIVVALVVRESGSIEGYDGLDKKMSKKEIDSYIKLLGIS